MKTSIMWITTIKTTVTLIFISTGLTLGMSNVRTKNLSQSFFNMESAVLTTNGRMKADSVITSVLELDFQSQPTVFPTESEKESGKRMEEEEDIPLFLKIISYIIVCLIILLIPVSLIFCCFFPPRVWCEEPNQQSSEFQDMESTTSAISTEIETIRDLVVSSTNNKTNNKHFRYFNSNLKFVNQELQTIFTYNE